MAIVCQKSKVIKPKTTSTEALNTLKYCIELNWLTDILIV